MHFFPLAERMEVKNSPELPATSFGATAATAAVFFVFYPPLSPITAGVRGCVRFSRLLLASFFDFTRGCQGGVVIAQPCPASITVWAG